MEQTNLLEPNRTSNETLKQRFKSCFQLLLSKISVRRINMFMLFAGFCNIYSLRCCFSIVIVEMIKNTTYTDKNGTILSEQEFEWNKREQGILLSAFFWGYVPSQLLGSLLTLKCGGILTIGLSIFIPSILSLVTPTCIDFGGFYILFIIRLLQGIFEAGVFPGTISFLSKWIPELERSRSFSLVIAGSYVGTFGGTLMSGVICHYSGWRLALQSAGTFGILWWIIWQLIVADTPEKCRLISSTELGHIQSTRGTSDAVLDNLKQVPFRKMLTSLPVWGLAIALFGDFCGIYTMLTELPTYLSDVYKIDILSIGMYSGLSYVCMPIFAVINGCLVDSINKHGLLRGTSLRKVCISLGLGSQALFLTIFVYSHNIDYSMACLTCGLCFGTMTQITFGPNCIELNAKYSSVITGFCTTIINIAGILSPAVSGILVKNGTREEWNNIFIIVICFHVFGILVFVMLGSAKYQQWD